MIILLMCMLFSFECHANTLPDDSVDSVIQQTSLEEIQEEDVATSQLVEEFTEEISTEVSQELIVDNSSVLQKYNLHDLVSFGYIRELPESVSMADFYIIVVRIYNLILMAVWVIIAFDVIDLVAKSIGRLKRKN